MLLRIYKWERDWRSCIVQPPARRGLFSPPSLREDIFALKMWSQRFQWGGTPRNPSHTMAKTVACITELGLSLCSSTQ